MNYRFNYDFFETFIQKNHLRQKDILEALGTKDYSTVKRWIYKTNPIATETILRLCNTYGLPLSVFFYDLDEPRPITIGNPGEGATLLAVGGYDNAKNATDPAPLFRKAVKWPVATTPVLTEASAKKKSEALTDDLRIVKIKLEYEQRINKLQSEHQAELKAVRDEYAKKGNEQKTVNKDIVEALRREVALLRDLIKKKDTGYTFDGEGFAPNYAEK